MRINRIFEIAKHMYFDEDVDSVKVTLDNGDFFIEIFGGIGEKAHDTQVYPVKQ